MSKRKDLKPLFEKLTPFLFILVVVLAFFVGFLWQKVNNLEKNTDMLRQQEETIDQGTQPQITMDILKELFKKDVIKLGDENRKILLVEIADPSCPYCHVVTGKNPELNRQIDTQTNRFKLSTDGGTYVAALPEFRKLVDSGEASFIYIYYPGHGNGELGMQALYCAQEKGKFWEVNDLLSTYKGYSFLNETVKNDVANSGQLATFLASVIDPEFMKDCLESGRYKDALNEDTSIASSLGVTGTPGFFINTAFFPGAYSYTDMESVVNQMLK